MLGVVVALARYEQEKGEQESENKDLSPGRRH